MKQVYQVVDGDQVCAQIPTTCTASKGKQYSILSRMRSDAVYPPTHARAGEATYTAEFFVVQDHWTKIIPVVVAQVSHKTTGDATLPLSADAKIVSVSVDDTTVDDAVFPPIE
jgi:hypothetical protein